ncbi:hypothetical protein Cpir12675_004189 [Ceratocystis pirilliformis]|uniref:COP9 signalosome complex subunit 1 n=1 Tax=Ceratocystis pirilliformis TaxID=259994 RepID=A0ABR3YXZ3_9PEZI
MGKCLLEDYYARDSIMMYEYVVRMNAETHVEAHTEAQVASYSSLLASQHELARAYYVSGQNKEATRMLERVVNIKEDILQAGAHLLLLAQRELAEGAKKGIPILENVVAAQEKTLPAEDHLLVVSQDALAHQYYENGATGKMVSLHEHVVEMREAELPSIHPLLLRSHQALASVYYGIDRVRIAVSLLQNDVKLQKILLRENDEDRMNSEALLKKWLVRSSSVAVAAEIGNSKSVAKRIRE